MSGRIRVLHILQSLNYGGMEKLLADLVCTIDRARFEMHVLTLDYRGRYSKEMEGLAEVHLGPRMSRASILRPAALAEALRAIAPDIVHTHSGVWPKGSRAARMARTRGVVHTEHGRQSEEWLSRLLDRRAARRTDVVISVSQPLKEYLVKRLGSSMESRIVVVRNGVDTGRFQPRVPSGRLRAELALSPDQPIIGSIGRLEPVKGYEVVIRAFAALPGTVGKRAALVVGGEGSARAELEALASSLGVANRVFLLGWRDDAEDLLAHFDCFVMGSWSEGTSVSLLEAMAAGLAPVVTAVGGNPDVLGPELAGQAVPAGAFHALAAKIAESLQPERRVQLGRQARERVRAAYDLTVMVRAYEGIYERLVPVP